MEKRKTASQLAKTLLAEQHARGLGGEEAITAAFAHFLDELDTDPSHRAALAELACESHAPDARGYFLERLIAALPAERKRRGVYFTPWPIARWIVDKVGEAFPTSALRIVDPACGGGVFLQAATQLIKTHHGSSRIGFDISTAAVECAQQLLADRSCDVECINPLAGDETLHAKLIQPNTTLVIVGNPPYANYGRLNRNAWIDQLLDEYRGDLRERKTNLTDDFVKFLRWGQYWIDRAGSGVLAMITSRTYLHGLTHRNMRRSLCQSFDDIRIVDLHGDGEIGDENVFSIRRGVAIGMLIKHANPQPTSVRYSSLRGSRDEKLTALNDDSFPCEDLEPESPDWLLVPPASETSRGELDYHAWPRLDEIFLHYVSGVQTKNDRLFVDFDRETLSLRMREHLPAGDLDTNKLRPYVVAPFDVRWIYYDPARLGRARLSVMQHLLYDNVALVFMRQSSGSETYDHALAISQLASDRVFYSRRGAPFVAPLWLDEAHTLSNLSPGWIDAANERIGRSATPNELFSYIYATLHSTDYRRKFLPQLKRDFPHIPWPVAATFAELVRLGGELLQLHLQLCSATRASEMLDNQPAQTLARGYPRWSAGQVGINRDFRLSLSETCWNLRVGGYQVVERYLKSRRHGLLGPHHLAYLSSLDQLAERHAAIVAAIDRTSKNGA